MARFTIMATIEVNGATIKSEDDAISRLQVLTDRYYALSVRDDADIEIRADKAVTHRDCPFCGSDETESEDWEEYFCRECHFIFREDDVVAEPIRHRISALLSADGQDEHTMSCSIPVSIGVITAISETIDGIIFFDMQGRDESLEFDSLPVEDLRAIEKALFD